MLGGREGTAVAAFVACNVAVATSPVAVRFTLREFEPLWAAAARFLVAAVLLAAVTASLRLAVPRGRALGGAVVFGTLNLAAAMGFSYYGYVRVHAGLGTVLFGLVPLAALLLAVAQRQERLHVRAVLGALLALAGVALLAQAPLRDTVQLLSLLSILASVLCVAQAAVFVRHFPAVHPVATNTVGCATAAAILLALSLLAGESPELPQRGETWVALAYLVVVGSIFQFILYLAVLARWAASRAAYVFVVSPFLTVVLSAWLDDEPVGVGLVFGAILIVIGVYIGALRPRPAPVPAVPPA